MTTARIDVCVCGRHCAGELKKDITPVSNGKRVLVTGGASGIGAAIARRFIEDGARVAIVDDGDGAMNQLGRAVPGVELALRGDVTDPVSLDAAFAEIDKVFGGLDLLFNNAGISIRERFLDVTFEDFERVLAVNLTGTFLVAQRAARRMIIADGGVIINIGSVSGLVGMPDYVGYNASKAGVLELTRTLALELAPRIRVNAISPGYVLTPMQEAEYSAEKLHEQEAKLPLCRLGRPAEIAALGFYLASTDARFITGQSFVIDGGETAGGLAST